MTVAQVAHEALHIETPRLGSADQRRIAAALGQLGWKRQPQSWDGKRWWTKMRDGGRVDYKVKYSRCDISVFFVDCTDPPRHISFTAAEYARLVEVSLGVTTGHPYYKTWQSRVLGPYIIKALTFGPLDYVHAHVVFQIVTVAIAAFLCWRLGRKYGGSDQVRCWL